VTIDADTVRRLAAAVDAAHLPGERIDGIKRSDAGRWEVHVVMAIDSTVSLVEADVLGAAGSVGITEPVDLFVEDVAERPAALPAGDKQVDTLLPGAPL
jgi:hypothetical protein